ncbi:carbohydrate sulfotransferase 5-like isoform X2 [Amphibalanus amphitrite]|uniref:carbohydrate sulfotransferase 5-like isoform X2 n=1 Tax=Amphibalanus amphitrite TaxID=1232801 RepID=UPI001C9069E8|nr:carbohydrate sulfotransferase 5-like isoform X2 [Amphibalanus amphitrite]XP_043227698.1 carbohydrate sulfotransferase 5-like isoform X2 [Amphibalanus amphitrite]XP_043227699.1 carbohydrate sulfotransferase 5-like isoform X2 [Amphibalanus amphitrite]XP_043227700.1 carbohydrate sulfotransferase 5-like isoform X2 [Amphibalanus amphitrite]XP_043227701.1 carbohydrate sulfotransferase 5-like isoform X2 [Amphibalanus amphitrite]
MARRVQLTRILLFIIVIGGALVFMQGIPSYTGHSVQIVAARERESPAATTRSSLLQPPSPTPSWQHVIDGQRDIIAQELADYQYKDTTLEELLAASGGAPRRSLVVTTWRSGSTFLGDVLNSHPAMFYHYEPLMDFGIRRARDGELLDKAVNNLHNLMNCKYDTMGEYISYSRGHTYVFLHNSRLWRYCRGGQWPACWRAQFLAAFCRLFPFQTAKTVRLPLAGAGALLTRLPDLRVLLLVRDPRGTMQSRRHRTWCPGNADCDDPARLCADLERDFETASRLGQTYGTHRLRVVRYEDFSVNVAASVPALMEFVGLQYHPRVRDFVKTHTTFSKGGVSSTFRNSTTAPFNWARSLSWTEVNNIQTKCANAMRIWKYKILKKKEWEVLNTNVDLSLKPTMFLDKFSLQNMLGNNEE